MFKKSIELDVHFITWKPKFFNNNDTDNIIYTAVVKSLKECK